MEQASVTDRKTGKQLDKLCEELQRVFGDDLLSVVLYGSAARSEDFAPGSDLNVLVVLKEITLESLERGTAPTRRWETQGNRPLLFFSPEWIRRSSDVFPLEFLDIQESHRVLAGVDPFAGLDVPRENLRLQCESELKTKLIHLRTGYMELHEDPEALSRLLASSYAPLVAILRGALRITGSPVPARSEEVVASAAKACGLDPAPFLEVAAIRRGGVAAASAKPVFKRYYAQMETLARFVDAGFTGGANR